jgi:hypothetical protein
MSRALVITGALFSIGIINAQSPGISGPVPGFTFDPPARSIRAVIGALGSASLGPALVPQLDVAFVAPRQNYAIAIRRGEVLVASGLGSPHVSLTELATELAGFSSVPEGVVWSDDASVAVLYSQTGGWIQIFTGFPGSISAGTQISTAMLGGSLSAIAADAHGQRIAIGISGNQGGVFEMAGSQNFSPLLGMAKPIALAYSPNDSVLYALDGSANQVSEINPGSSAQTLTLDAEDAVAIRPALDAANHKVLYVAARSSRLLLVYDRSTHQLSTSVPLSFEPSIIDPFGLDGFLLTRRSSAADPLWSFTNYTQPVVYFVPAAPVSEPRREVGRK